MLDDVEVIDLDELDIHTYPFLTHQLLVFITMNLYRGGHEIERTIITQKT
jgi:hypothetical protein